MSDLAVTDLRAELERVWQAKIPLSNAIGIRIARTADDTLETRAALEPNINVHGTAFAGSLYAIAALTGWGSVWLALRRRGRDASIVIAEGNIRYLRPVASEIVARCRFDRAAQESAWRALDETGKCRFQLEVAIDGDGAEAARFVGSYAVRIEPRSESSARAPFTPD